MNNKNLKRNVLQQILKRHLFTLGFLSFCLFFIQLSAFAQTDPEDLQIKIYSFEDNLSHRNVYKIAQDPWGFIWVATINGLNRFDGKSFTHYTNSLEEQFPISNQFISDIAISDDALIWLSIDDYIVQLDPKTNKSHKIKVSDASVVYDKKRSFHNLFTDKKNQLWTATYLDESGTSFLQKTNKDGTITDIISCDGTFAKRPIIQLSDHYFVSNRENRLLEINESGKLIKEHVLPPPQFNYSVGWVTQMQITSDGRLWVLQNNGLVYSRGEGESDFKLHPISERLLGNSIYNALLVEDDGSIWVGGMGILWYYDQLSQKLYDYNSPIQDLLKHTCTIRQIFQDATGVIWLATDYGVIKLLQSDQLFKTYLSEGNEYCGGACSLRGITGDEKGNIYFSYYNSIHVLEKESNLLRPVFTESKFYNPPFGLLYHQGHLYTGNGKKINLENLEITSLLGDQTTDLGALLLDQQKQIWLAYKNKIFRYNPLSDEINFYPTPSIDTSNLNIAHLHQNKAGDIWMSTMENGVFKIDPSKGIQSHFNASEKSSIPLQHNKINQGYEDKNGNLWLASGAGLHQINLAEASLKVYTTKNGLPNDFINAFLSEGDSVLWLTTDNGLSRFSISDQRFTNFFKKDGLAANEFNRMSYYKSPDGRLFFGGLHGATMFNPSLQFLKEREQKEGKILFTGFSKLDGKYDSLINIQNGLNGKEKIHLTAYDKFFKFEFGLANYQNPVDNLYSYRLDPYDSKWSPESKSTEARYGIIPPGDYVFRVRAKTGKGFWNQQELAMKIHVERAYYKTWWFLSLMTLLGILCVYGVISLRTFQLRKRRKQLEEEVVTRTQELSREKKKSDDLLLNILPAETADELKAFGKAKAKRYDTATVFFSDFKDFTLISQQLEPEKLVADIDYCFRAYDEIMDKYGIEKIKTVGDAYMCAGGIPTENKANAVMVVKAALEVQQFMRQLERDKSKSGEPFFESRIGIHTGPVVAGIVGIKKFAFDIWGDTVNIAARMEDKSQVGKVNISQSTYELVKDHFHCTYRGKITAKNKGEIDMYFVDGLTDFPTFGSPDGGISNSLQD